MSGTPEFVHEPVLRDAVIEAFAPVPAGWLVDGTVGGAGHAAALLAAHPHLSLLGIDRDPDAVAVASDRLAPYGDRALVIHTSFDRLVDMSLRTILRRSSETDAGIPDVDDAPAHLSGVLLDLGVSSPQLDRGERGFSYRNDGPLDMRMDTTTGTTARDLVNELDADELAALIRRGGDERHAWRVAKAIVAARPIDTTAQLAQVVREAVPAAARRTGGHPATRTFQALRIAVNDELGQLEAVLGDAIDALAPGGRMAVITYHSGEDRIVARRFRDLAADDCVCPPGIGECRCGGAPSVRLVPRKAIVAAEAEVEANPRARSARLRVAEKLGEAS